MPPSTSVSLAQREADKSRARKQHKQNKQQAKLASSSRASSVVSMMSESEANLASSSRASPVLSMMPESEDESEDERADDDENNSEALSDMGANLVDNLPSADQVNSDISDALLRGKPPGIMLLEYSRDPTSFHELLKTCPELKACRAALIAKGFTPELPQPCGAKIFVPPDLFDVAKEAVRLQGIKLHSRHVLVSDDLTETVINVVKNKMKLSKKEKTKLKNHRGIKHIPLGPAMFEEPTMPYVVKHTFIHVQVTSSLRSSPPTDAQRTVSSGNHVNPRRV